MRSTLRKFFRRRPLFEVIRVVNSTEPKPTIGLYALLHEESGHGPLVRELLDRLKQLRKAEINRSNASADRCAWSA